MTLAMRTVDDDVKVRKPVHYNGVGVDEPVSSLPGGWKLCTDPNCPTVERSKWGGAKVHYHKTSRSSG